MFVVDMSLAGVKPKDILNALKRRHEHNASTMRTIYNAKSTIRAHSIEGRSAMQQLFKVIVEKHYVFWHRSNETTDEVLDLFWAHPESILLAKCFPSVVLVDCTYKTNRYQMPLFAMVGITSTGKTFFIAHCFLHRELEDNYQWALSRLKMLFASHDLPNIFVTDMEFAVINAIKSIFPEARRLLFMFHISRNVQQHCKPKFKSESIWEKFIQSWTKLILATSQKEFFNGWDEFKKDWHKFSNCVDYLARTWFQHREFFVLAWTNQIKHFGNTTTNRAEGSHGKLKKHLDTSQGTFSIVFGAMDNMLSNQITEVKAAFENSLRSTKLFHHGMPFRDIKESVSHFALDLIKSENDRSIEMKLA